MADELLSATLDLSIDAALAAADTLGNALTDALTSSVDLFSTAMVEAVGGVPDVTITPDTAEVAPAITTAVDSADGTVQVQAAGAETITGDIDGAVAAADTTVHVDADTAPALAAVEGVASEAESLNPQVVVEADTSQAQGSLDELDVSVTDLSSSTSGLGQNLSSAGGGARDFGTAASFAAAGTGLAVGSANELQGATASLGGSWGAAAAGGAAFTAGLAELFHAGVNAAGATQRFQTILGPLAADIQTINVGSLSVDLDKLGISFGSTGAQMQQTAASLVNFARVSGASDQVAERYSETLFALAARAVSLNPALGSVSDVADQMSVRLARGGRFAALFGVSLTQSEISARAMLDTGKQLASELTIYEKSAAAAELATAKYGNTLGTTVAAGTQNAINQSKSLDAQFKQLIEELGRSIVIPVFDLIRTSLPIVEDFGRILQTLATGAVPALTLALQAVEPVFSALATVLDAISPAIGPLTLGFLAFEAATTVLPAILGGVGLGFSVLAGVLPVVGDAALAASGAVQVASEAMSATSVGLLIAGLAAGAAAFGLFGGGADEAATQVKSFSDALDQANGKVTESTLKATRSMLDERNQADDLAATGLKLSDVLKSTANAGEGQRAILVQLVEQAKLLETTSSNNATILGTYGRSVSDVEGKERDLIGQLRVKNPLLAQVAQAILTNNSANRGFIQTLLDMADATAKSNQKLDEHRKIGGTDAQIQTQLSSGVKAVADEVRNTTGAFAAAEDAAVRYGLGIGTAKDLTAALKVASQELQGELDLLLGRFIDADTASNNYGLAVIKLNEQLFASGFALDNTSQAGLTNRNSLDALGKSAEAAGTAILNQTGSVTQAIGPLTDFRNQVQALRDKMAAAGQDTSFEDQLLRNVDAAIAGIRSKDPDAQKAVQEFTRNAANAGRATAPDWAVVGAFLSGTAVDAGRATAPDWVALGAFLSSQGSGSAAAAAPDWTLVGNTLALSASGGAVAAAPAMRGAGQNVGAQGTAGTAEGLAPMPGVAASSVLQSVDAAALAGANAHNVGYGIGASFSAGIGDGIIANDGYVSAQATAVIDHAHTAARTAAQASSPSRLFMAVGRDLALGAAAGLRAATDSDVVPAARDMFAAAAGQTAGVGPLSTPAGAAPAGGGGSTFITFSVDVHGVSDPAVGRTVGEQVVAGAVDTLSRRGALVRARLG